MANISIAGAKSGRRALDHDLPLVPFIDFMVCLIAFLMVTAVWTQLSRIAATARAPGDRSASVEAPRKELHLFASRGDFELRWQTGSTLLESERVPRIETATGRDVRFRGLGEAITRQWQAGGQHRAETDAGLDHAVIHVRNDAPFAEIVALLDALSAPRRGDRSAFDVALATE